MAQKPPLHFKGGEMNRKIFLVTDLGGGDGGKGGVVHKICSEMNAHTVIKVGGGQGSHGVRTKSGQSFNFSHFGCGTFEGVKTHISKNMVIDPSALVYEGELLKYENCIRNVFDLITVEEDVLCVTPFHRIASRLRELSRKDNPKGTIGVGVGEAVLDSETYPDTAIYVGDIVKDDLGNKLEAIRIQKLKDLQSIISGTFFDNDRELAIDLIQSLQNQNLIGKIIESFREMISLIKIVDRQYLKERILSREGSIVVESSHGVLTDRYYGFHPHTTKLRTVPSFTLDLLKENDYDGNIVKLGVTRAYQIRHGAGPMVTEDPKMLERLLPGSNKEENRWQGKVRVGSLDFVALRYAINVCGGPESFDGLALTWFDQIQTIGKWQVCNRYTETGNFKFFSNDREINVSHNEGDEQLDYQERLGKILRGCRPILSSYYISPDSSRESLTDLCGGVLQEKLGIPLSMISFGPTEQDKICL